MTPENWLDAVEKDWNAAWPNANSVHNLLLQIKSRRKLKLFALACCRSIEDSLPDPRCRRVLAIAEKCIDGLATMPEWESAYEDSKLAMDGFQQMLNEKGMVGPETHCAAAHAADTLIAIGHSEMCQHTNEIFAQSIRQIVCNSELEHWLQDRQCGKQNHARWQANALTDIIGPSELPEFDPEWRTSATVSLAQFMYESRDFSRMPILKNALRDSGCSRVDILDHCQSESLHVKGCWVLELVLGKE
jgi:hypothetical protein